MKKYRIDARWPKDEIKEVEVIRETELSIWLAPDPHVKHGKPSQVRKQSEWHEYYDTWELAHAALMKNTYSRLLAAQRSLNSAEGLHGNVKGMKPPWMETGTPATSEAEAI